MATKNMAYDHPAYLAVINASLPPNSAGANSQTGRFVAWTSMAIKSVQAMTTTSGTSTTHVVRALIFRNGGTSTETTVCMTLGSAALATSVGNFAATSTMTLGQGDSAALTAGTDATIVIQGSLELVIQPGANVTA